jgi:hypothetical protein
MSYHQPRNLERRLQSYRERTYFVRPSAWVHVPHHHSRKLAIKIHHHQRDLPANRWGRIWLMHCNRSMVIITQALAGTDRHITLQKRGIIKRSPASLTALDSRCCLTTAAAAV